MKLRWNVLLLPLGLLILGHCGLQDSQNRPSAEGPEAVSQASRSPLGGFWAAVDSVSCVGMETCGICHPGQHSTYPHTGMGRSFGPATVTRSDADFSGHPSIHDPNLDLTYRPFWRGDSFLIAEYRVRNGDTVHYREETVDHIIGSGQHTNSHLLERQGYLYQAPITFYTQERRWDLAPGFADGHNSRFSRAIETECITCHNGLPTPLAGTLNGYEAIPAGIDCERCHGPGAEHVRQKLAGNLVDTSRYTDYTIVNPAQLPLEAQLDLCQRCHLQGIAVLHDESDWFDFRPGDRIKEHWNVFLPDFPGNSDQFLMASQAERLQQSPCFVATGGFACQTCHNPHLTVKETPRGVFNNPCQSCHGEQQTCTMPVAERIATNGDDCSRCHMPRTGSVDIPHVTITDHRVRVPGREQPRRSEFAGLACLTDENPDPLTMAKAYLRFYEAFKSDRSVLDSAEAYLKQSEASPDEARRTALHLAYLRDDMAGAASLVGNRNPADWSDAWACYRAGEALGVLGNARASEAWLARAASLLPRHPPFLVKHANALTALGLAEKARARYLEALALDNRQADAWSNLGFLEWQSGKPGSAEIRFRRAAALDPDYLPARIQLVQLLMATQREGEARELLRAMQTDHPQDESVRLLSERLLGSNPG